MQHNVILRWWNLLHFPFWKSNNIYSYDHDITTVRVLFNRAHLILDDLQDGALKLAPSLLHGYVVEGVPILVPHPVNHLNTQFMSILLDSVIHVDSICFQFDYKRISDQYNVRLHFFTDIAGDKDYLILLWDNRTRNTQPRPPLHFW